MLIGRRLISQSNKLYNQLSDEVIGPVHSTFRIIIDISFMIHFEFSIPFHNEECSFVDEIQLYRVESSNLLIRE